MIDNDVTGLPTVLSNDPVASFRREPGAGVSGEHGVPRALGDEIGDTLGWGKICRFSVRPETPETHPWYHCPPAPGWAATALTTTGTLETRQSGTTRSAAGHMSLEPTGTAYDVGDSTETCGNST